MSRRALSVLRTVPQWMFELFRMITSPALTWMSMPSGRCMFRQLSTINCPFTCKQREIYQAPACIYNDKLPLHLLEGAVASRFGGQGNLCGGTLRHRGHRVGGLVAV